MFWQQMLNNTRVNIVSNNGKKYIYFHGGKAFKTMINASQTKAYRQTLTIVHQITNKSNFNIEASLKKAKASYINMGTKYLLGKGTQKIAMLEQYIAPTVKGATKGNLIGLIIVVGIESFKFFSQPESERHLTDYLATVGVAIVKFAISTGVGLLFAATGFALAATGVLVAPAVAIVVSALAVSFFVGVLLDWVDKDLLGITDSVKDTLKSNNQGTGVISHLDKKWQYM
jgi:hypothetical protein